MALATGSMEVPFTQMGKPREEPSLGGRGELPLQLLAL